jgi:hypothetical protein
MNSHGARRLLGLFGAVLATLVGLLFAVLGGFLVASQSWAAVTGTVGDCQPRSVRSGSSSTVHQHCEVSWEADGVPDRATVDLGPTRRVPGEQVELRVSGDLVTPAGPAWVGWASLAVGVALLGGGALLAIRSRRPSS